MTVCYMRERDVKKAEREFHDSEGSDLEVRYVRKNPQYKYNFSRAASLIRSYLQTPSIVVDVGCGTGRGSIFFIDCAETIVGLDISKVLLQIFKSKAKKLGTQKATVHLILADAENIPLREDVASLSSFWTALHHLPNKPKGISEAVSTLKKGGIVTIYEPTKQSSKIPRIIGRIMGALFSRFVLTVRNPEILSPHEAPIDLEQIQALVSHEKVEIIAFKLCCFISAIPLDLPPRIAELFYCLADKLDARIEHKFKGSSFLLIAQKR